MMLTIFRKGLILVAVPLLFQLVLIVGVAAMHRQLQEADQDAERSKHILLQSEAVSARFLDLEAGFRGYVLTEKAAFTESYDRAVREVPEALLRMRALVGDEPQLRARIAELEPRAVALMHWYADRIQEVRAGARDTAIARIANLEGKQQMDAIRGDMDAVRAEVERLARAQSLLREERLHILRGILLGGAMLAVATTLVLAFLFTRGISGISGRLAVLVDNARRLTQGRELAAPVRGSDEVAAVDQAFRDMARAVQLYADIVQRVPLGLTIWRLDRREDDASLRLVDANPAASELLGIDVHALLGRPILEAFPGVAPEHLRSYADVVRSGTAVTLQEVHYGDERVQASYWSVRVFPLPDQGVGLAFENISARRQAEEKLREQANLLDQTHDAVLVWEWEGPITYWNRGAERLYGFSPEEAQGSRSHSLLQTQPAEAVEAALAQLADTGQWQGELVHTTREGRRLTVSTRMVLLHQGSRRVVLETNRDITERKEYEQRLQRFNHELEQRVAERTGQLAEANRDLAHKNQENEMFVYSVSHDLRSPLVNLQGFSKELQRVAGELRTILGEPEVPPGVRERCLALLEGRVAKSIHFIQTGVTRLSSIIDALLRLSRAGRVEYRSVRVDVQAMVQRIVDSLKVTQEERGATIQVHELPPARGDAAALEQVFANLVGNSLKYLDPKRPGQIEIGAVEDSTDGQAPGMRTYYVKDNGLGIPETGRVRAFQPFQRLHPHAAPGEGMGLAILQRIVDRHGGKVWVESTVGVGSTFFVSLPAGSEDESSGEAAAFPRRRQEVS